MVTLTVLTSVTYVMIKSASHPKIKSPSLLPTSNLDTPVIQKTPPAKELIDNMKNELQVNFNSLITKEIDRIKVDLPTCYSKEFIAGIKDEIYLSIKSLMTKEIYEMKNNISNISKQFSSLQNAYTEHSPSINELVNRNSCLELENNILKENLASKQKLIDI